MHSSKEWNGFGQFLREIETSLHKTEEHSVSERAPTAAKYHLDDIGIAGSTLDDGIAFIDQLRTFAKQGILVSVGSQRSDTES
jgi:hypothetical protein